MSSVMTDQVIQCVVNKVGKLESMRQSGQQMSDVNYFLAEQLLSRVSVMTHEQVYVGIAAWENWVKLQ